MAAAQVSTQPDIIYHPNFDGHQVRSQHRQQIEKLLATLPSGFPRQLSSPLVWEGKDVEANSDWIVKLTEPQLDVIEQALNHFRCT
jgi:hypothetical protein